MSEKPMNKTPKKTKPSGGTPEMLPEYDFTKGVRGKHSQAYQRGHAVQIHRADGTISVQHFSLEDGAVMLAQDVREYFPDSDAVNQALRALIHLVPQKRARVTKK